MWEAYGEGPGGQRVVDSGLLDRSPFVVKVISGKPIVRRWFVVETPVKGLEIRTRLKLYSRRV